jgi:DUF4097 and DUF4098 domain-containing protein YvlB
MSMTLAMVATAVLSLSTHTDTTLTVKPGARLELDNFGGQIVVKSWSRDAVRIEADHSSRTEIDVEQDGNNLSVKAENRRGVPTEVDFKLTVPAWMALELSGVYTDVEVSGTKGDVKVETVQGDVTVTGGSGFVQLQSVEGEVKLSGASGKIEVSAVNQGVEVSNVQGELSVEGVNGNISISGSTASSVEASTVNGEISFDGELKKDGRYQFSTHSGDISVGIPERSDVEVSVSTYSGDFDSTFPVSFTKSRRGRTFEFKLGAGSAQLEIESFQGTVELHRPGEHTKSSDDDTPAKDKPRQKDKSKDEENQP